MTEWRSTYDRLSRHPVARCSFLRKNSTFVVLLMICSNSAVSQSTTILESINKFPLGNGAIRYLHPIRLARRALSFILWVTIWVSRLNGDPQDACPISLHAAMLAHFSALSSHQKDSVNMHSKMNRPIQFRLLVTLIAMAACWNSANRIGFCLQQKSVPSESELPGLPDQFPAPEKFSGNEVELPSESTLPRSLERHSTQPRRTNEQQNVPPEGSLPVAARSQQQTEEKSEVQQLLDESRDGFIWLRLDGAQHTAPITSIVLNEDETVLFTGGRDKLVHRWERTDDGNINLEAGGKSSSLGGWQHVETYRWQVQRLDRGAIASLAFRDDTLYLAGRNAEGRGDPIAAINVATDQWLAPIRDMEIGHHVNIARIATLAPDSEAPNSRRLVSVDQYGNVRRWQQDPNAGTWNCTPVYSVESTRQFRFVPLASSETSFAYAKLDSTNSNSWEIEIETLDGVRTTLVPPKTGMSRQSVAPLVETLGEFFKSRGKKRTTEENQRDAMLIDGEDVSTVAMDRSGESLAVGTEVNGFVYVFRVSDKNLLFKNSYFRSRIKHVQLSADARTLAYLVESIDSDECTLDVWQMAKNLGWSRIYRHQSTGISALRLLEDGGSAFVAEGSGLTLHQFTEPKASPKSQLAIGTDLVAPIQSVAFANSTPYRWKIVTDGDRKSVV